MKTIRFQLLYQVIGKSSEKTINELNQLLELRSQKGFKLHVKEVRKRGNQTKIEDIGYKLSKFDIKKKRDFSRIKNCKLQ